jgi:MFS family permease
MNQKRTMTRRWLNRAVWGIVLATFFSDFSHEMATAVLPDFIRSIALGPMALGLIEGVADFLVSLSKLGGGILGHHVERKKPWAAAGYLITSTCTSAIGLTKSLMPMVVLRTIAWAGRGYRSPLRDFLLADAVEKTHYGRAFGLERAGDMLGAVAGPMFAALMVFFQVPLGNIILFGIVPGMIAAAAMFFVVQERSDSKPKAASEEIVPAIASNKKPLADVLSQFPRMFWLLLIGVLIFGLGDFSRTFLVLLAAAALQNSSIVGEAATSNVANLVWLPMVLYAMHNAVSALAAYPAGRLGDRRAKLPVLVGGYALGVVTNVLLAIGSGSIVWLSLIFLLSGTYIAIEETLEKATVAEIIPRHLRSLGLGILATGNAVGDMASSLYVGYFLQVHQPQMAFGIAAALGTLGTGWMLIIQRARRKPAASPAG